MLAYHCSPSKDLTIIKNEGQYGGIFVSFNPCKDYGDHVYAIMFDSICSTSDIQNYLDENPKFLKQNPNFVADCDEAIDDDHYFKNQKLRADIARELGFDAVEENDGFLVVNGTVKYIGLTGSDEVNDFVDENWG